MEKQSIKFTVSVANQCVKKLLFFFINVTSNKYYEHLYYVDKSIGE